MSMTSVFNSFKSVPSAFLRSSPQIFRGRHGGFHGTTIQDLGDNQIYKRLFDKKGLPIYFDSFSVASQYALKKKWDDIGGSSAGFGAFRWYPYNKDAKPVVLAISSNTKPEINDVLKNPHLNKHYFFPAESTVQIDGIWELDPNVNPTEFLKICAEEERRLNLGGAALKVVNFVGRVSNLLIRY